MTCRSGLCNDFRNGCFTGYGGKSVNVIGDMTGTLLVAKSEKEVDVTKWSA